MSENKGMGHLGNQVSVTGYDFAGVNSVVFKLICDKFSAVLSAFLINRRVLSFTHKSQGKYT